MGVERYSNRLASLALGAPHNLVQHVTVGAVDPIEITHADKGWAEVTGNCAQLAKDLHGLDLELQLQSVISQLDLRRKVAIRFTVGQVVTDVREERAFGLQASGDPERVFDRRMGGMRLVSKGVQKNNIEAAQFFERAFGNLAKVGQVGCGAEAKSPDFRIAMQDRNGFESEAI